MPDAAHAPEDKPGPLAYLDFELEIGLGKGRVYPLSVLHSPGGEARARLDFPFDELALERYADKLNIALLRSGGRLRVLPSAEEREVQAFGSALFEALMPAPVRRCYERSLERAAQQGCGLRLKLRIQPPELAALPWEYLYDPAPAEYLCLCADTPLVRYIELPQPPQPLAVRPPLRILGLLASPRDLEPLDVDSERARLERALAGLQKNGQVELHWLERPTWRDLQRALRTGVWHVFHYVGHGRFNAQADEGQLAFEDDEGQAHLLNATQAARLLANHRHLRLALLNACEGGRGGLRDIFSSTAAILVRRGLPAVLAMQHKISDRAAIEFGRAFYEALADGLPVDAAVTEARTAVSLALNNTLEWGTPVLYLRSPDGVLFDWQPVVRSEQPPAQAEKPALEPVEKPIFSPPAKQQDELVLELAPGVPLALRRVPAGEFLMGSDDSDSDARDEEKPQHRVWLDEYWIGKYPVTTRQYQAFVQAAKRRVPSHWENGQIPQGKEDHPVVNVTWEDTVAFCRWAGQQSGRALRLPTEAEWEKAASWESEVRSGQLEGKKRRYPWGEQPPDKGLCNFGQQVGDTTPVGQYSPQGDSPCGCADMAGNVWEWCTDWYDGREYARRAGKEVRNPDGPPKGQYRALRGGSWYWKATWARCAYRYWRPPGTGATTGVSAVVAPRLLSPLVLVPECWNPGF
ncbi:MAG: SUMF1/EgtB/PvdO family nonheme iron enzyme [Chloroflexota bacterium]